MEGPGGIVGLCLGHQLALMESRSRENAVLKSTGTAEYCIEIGMWKVLSKR